MTASLEPALLAHGPNGSRNLLDRFSHISPEQWELAERRFRRIKTITVFPDRSPSRRIEIRRASVDLQVNEATIYRWLAKEPREALDLIPRQPGIPPGRSRLRAPVRALIDDGLSSLAALTKAFRKSTCQVR